MYLDYDQPLFIDDELVYGWWVEGMWVCPTVIYWLWLGLWLMSGGYLEYDQPLVIDDELVYGWWVEGMWVWPTVIYWRWIGIWLMSGGYVGMTNRYSLTMTRAMADEWRVSECDQPLVIDYDVAYDWWVEGIWVWPTVSYWLWLGLWLMSGGYLSVTNR